MRIEVTERWKYGTRHVEESEEQENTCQDLRRWRRRMRTRDKHNLPS